MGAAGAVVARGSVPDMVMCETAPGARVAGGTMTIVRTTGAAGVAGLDGAATGTFTAGVAASC